MAIRKLDTTKLPNDRHLGFVGQVYDILRGYSYQSQPVYEERKAALKSAIDAEDVAYKQSQKNFKTDKMHEEDALRDDYMQAARAILAGYTLLPDSEPQKQKCVELLQVWKDYKFSTSDSYTGESVKIDNMWQVLEPKEELLKQLGVWEILQKAVEHNGMVKAYFEIRNQEKSGIEAGALKTARTATDKAYQQMIELLDAVEVVKPGTIHPSIYKQLDELTDYYKQYYLSRKLSAKKKEDEEATPVEAETAATEPPVL